VNSAKSNALTWPVTKKNLEMVKLLVDFGADIDQKNTKKVSALDVARNRNLTGDRVRGRSSFPIH
jgi:hypothetical protein